MEELKQEDFKVELIKDLGMIYPTPGSKTKARYAKFKCPHCGTIYRATVNNVKRGKSLQCNPNCDLYKIPGGELTQNTLRELFDYNPLTGQFHRKVIFARRHSVGALVGVQHPKGYLKCGIGNKEYTLHRLAWLYLYGRMPEIVDHINGDRQDNRQENLREVNLSENSRNMKRSKANTSGFTGVGFDKARQKWKANIVANGKPISKRFDTLEQAIEQRKAWNLQYDYHENHGRKEEPSLC